MNEEEKKTIDLFIKKIDKCDETVAIKDLSVGEEYRMLQTVEKGLYLTEKLQLELNQEKEKNKKLEEERLTGIQVKCIQYEAYIKARADFERDYRENSQLYEKVIDMMADELIQDGIFVNSNVEDVKDYYFKKARGEKNGQVNI